MSARRRAMRCAGRRARGGGGGRGGRREPEASAISEARPKRAGQVEMSEAEESAPDRDRERARASSAGVARRSSAVAACRRRGDGPEAARHRLVTLFAVQQDVTRSCSGTDAGPVDPPPGRRHHLVSRDRAGPAARAFFKRPRRGRARAGLRRCRDRGRRVRSRSAGWRSAAAIAVDFARQPQRPVRDCVRIGNGRSPGGWLCNRAGISRPAHGSGCAARQSETQA